MDAFDDEVAHSDHELEQKRQPSKMGNFDALVRSIVDKDDLDARMGFVSFDEGAPRLGWLVNMQPSLLIDETHPQGRSVVDLYFLQEDGASFRATVFYEPYLFVLTLSDTQVEVEEHLKKKFKGTFTSIGIVEKDDLSLPNHLSGHSRQLIKVSFENETKLQGFKKALMTIVRRNAKSGKGRDELNFSKMQQLSGDPEEYIVELREHDLLYYTRVAIDNDLRVGWWYECKLNGGVINIQPVKEKVSRPDPVVMAFDIETTKLPLKFPDANLDSIMMISYMIDGQGYLITNREIVAKDIADFSFNPKPEYSGHFTVFNEPDERSLLERFFEHFELARPTVVATYNGDFFDWPFVEARAKAHGISMKHRIGFQVNNQGEYLSSFSAHLDCFYWVKRDSYLPQGSQSLKAVATYKLGYNPIELDPEDMTKFAIEKPQVLAQYSVSDAVATYYLYMKYVHPFIFSLCNIIPMNPDDVLRRGSGTLCEHLLMVQAYKANVIMPNKHEDAQEKFYDNRLLNSETYVGGHVEALEAGVFRSDIPTRFRLEPSAVQQLIDEVDHALHFSIQVEAKENLEDIVNYDQVKQEIVQRLEALRDNPTRVETPFIYHLDVAAMYPNIILTNRLQPDAVIDDDTCATCDYNEGPDSLCQRRMTWSWRGESFTAKRGEITMIKNQLEHEKALSKEGRQKAFAELTKQEQAVLIKKRVSDYSRKVYGKAMETKIIEKESVVCQRENPFYINTVRDFRDRRYDYKRELKNMKKVLDKAQSDGDATAISEAQKLIIIYDSLQLAHKCILNSFYGYVMRKGARWYSMEMAGIVCLTGAKIIQLARSRIEQLGRPLELDTDGIWCMLPSSFPENFTFKLKNGKTIFISYPCVMLNHLVHDQFTNHQYQDFDGQQFKVKSENSIFFEVDGPYRAMILPASTEEDKLLKKRYAVFNFDGSLAELKGFEVKRRGELKLIKNFQSNIFKVFLEGKTQEECYQAVAKVCDQWLDILFTKAAELSDSELFELISENRSMSKSLEEYGSQKSTSITTAKRLAEFLGDQMVKDKGLNCKFIIACKPAGLPVSERAIPVTIFSTEPEIKQHYLRKWLKDNSIRDPDIRDILDWDYYLERFGSVIQKLVTIPAAMQHVKNPVPRIQHPDWLAKRLLNQNDKTKQRRITEMLRPMTEDEKKAKQVVDIEDMGPTTSKRRLGQALVKKHKPLLRSESKYPNPMEDYGQWLRAMKIEWKHMLRQQGCPLFKQAVIQNYFQTNYKRFKSDTFEILCISETDVPGIFKLWTISDGNMTATEFEVPRILYLNTREENAVSFSGPVKISKTFKILPRNRQAFHLYELELPETFYRSHSSLFSSAFNSKQVEGVYEGQMSLMHRALLDIGCFGQWTKKSLGGDRSYTDIMQPKVKNDLYLSQTVVHLIHLFQAKSGSNEMWGLYDHHSQQVHVFVVDPAMNIQGVPNFNRLYAEVSEEKPVCKSKVYPDTKQAVKDLNSLLEKLRSVNRPTVLGIQTTGNLQYLKTLGLFSVNLFPVLQVPLHKADTVFPALTWQTYSGRRMIGHFMNFKEFVVSRIELARYSNVPVCNIESDYPLFLSDIFLSRKLSKGKMLLWCSSSSKPDLGGSEIDDNRFTYDVDYPEYNFPGKHDTICIQIAVFDLALNTIIQSVGLQADAEQNIVEAAAKNVHLMDDHIHGERFVKDGPESLSHVLLAIRSVVKGWLDDLKKGNVYASHLLEHFHRWLISNTTQLYDPLIVSHVNGLMKKCFVALLEEVKRLGSNVIHASVDKLVISTTKTDLKIASGYLSYLFAAIQKNPAFQHIEFKIERFWDYYLWMDPYNYGGIYFASSEEDPEQSELLPDMQWNIGQFLPPAVQKEFLKVVAEFIGNVHKVRKQNPSLVTDYFTKLKQQLFQLVQDIRLHKISDHQSMEFPVRPGSCRPMHNPALEMIKMVIAVFELESGLQREVRVLKRDLLSLINVKEFSSEAVFTNPCENYVLHQFTCPYCSHTTDLDLTCATDVIEETGELEPLSCSACLAVYDMDEIEQRLLEDVQTLLSRWQLQDLVCKNCKFVNAEDLRQSCARCTGQLVMTVEEKAIRRQVQVLHNLADHFEMPILNQGLHLL
ncbi:hypothetical protein EDD86DRAFT_210666 [Gorgonomyces haynaldii]|nr:hypothetical protein EDD86DRAFT_210666 [Gorgonomyces haynaldii]